MKLTRIPDNNGDGEYLIIHGDVDRVNAEEHFFERHVSSRMFIQPRLLKRQGIITSENEGLAQKVLLKMALQSWPDELARIKGIAIPDYLIQLLSSQDKATQIRLLKGATITAEQLAAFALLASNQGFTYSRYREQQPPKGVDPASLPRFIEKQADGSIKASGHTTLKDGQLNQILEQRKAIVATIFDKEEEWHCFFATDRGLAGRENYKTEQGGQPHMHYISSKWGSVTRQQVMDGVRSGKYVSSSVHIDLLELNIADGDEAEDSPPSTVTGTKIDEPVWLGASGSLYAHHYPAKSNVATCGRYNTIAQIRSAWLTRKLSNKPHCPACTRRLSTT